MSQFRLNAKNVVQDLIDGEVLAIRSDTGAYYSMTGPTCSAWLAVISGQPLAAAAEVVALHHGAAPDEVADDLHTFARMLTEEALVVLSVVSELEEDDEGVVEWQLPSETAATVWTTPAFEKYVDMQDLLLFDPIHEVQNTGWPNAAGS